MNNLGGMIWIETRKAIRSRMPLWTGLGSLLLPLSIAFLIFVSRNPVIAQKLGLVSAKANLIAYSGTDWSSYLRFSCQMIAAGGFFLAVLVISWVFGREFADGTLKDLLAVPVLRLVILLAKFCVTAIWSVGLAGIIIAGALTMGAIIGLPGGSFQLILRGSGLMAWTAGLTILVILPFAFLASVGRGYLLPLSIAIFIVMMSNLVAVIGYGEYFPWAVPGLLSQSNTPLSATSYMIVALTALTGMWITHLWWKYADQNR